MLPSLFISHGAPSLVLDDSPARTFLASLPTLLPQRPKAILVVSAHWQENIATLNGLGRQSTIHDFGGFPDVLYKMQYPAPGAPDLVQHICSLLQAGGIQSRQNGIRGLDHGAWIPLRLAWPQADIPVVQLSLLAGASVDDHFRLGRALSALRNDNILILGSGSFTHNIREWIYHAHTAGRGQPAWVKEFCDWMHARVIGGDFDALRDYRAAAPSAQRNHPTEEHLMPLFVALAAAGTGPKAHLIHSSADHDIMRMDAYRFDGGVS